MHIPARFFKRITILLKSYPSGTDTEASAEEFIEERKLVIFKITEKMLGTFGQHHGLLGHGAYTAGENVKIKNSDPGFFGWIDTQIPAAFGHIDGFMGANADRRTVCGKLIINPALQHMNSTTMNIYSHVLPSVAKEAAQKIGSLVYDVG